MASFLSPSTISWSCRARRAHSGKRTAGGPRDHGHCCIDVLLHQLVRSSENDPLVTVFVPVAPPKIDGCATNENVPVTCEDVISVMINSPLPFSMYVAHICRKLNWRSVS